MIGRDEVDVALKLGQECGIKAIAARYMDVVASP